MGALKRLTSATFYAVLSIIAIWTLCMIVLVPLQPKASQANKLHQLGTFSSYAFDLIIRLQNEMFLIADATTTATPDFATKLSVAAKDTGMARHGIVKTWGRFDSSPYPKVFRSQIETGFTQLDELIKMRDSGQFNSASSLEVIKPYISTLGKFIHLDPYIDQLQSVDQKTLELRNDFSNALKLIRAMQNEFLTGVRTISGKSVTSGSNAEWLAAIKRRNQYLKRFISGLDMSDSSTKYLRNILHERDIGLRFQIDAESGQTANYPNMNIWIATYDKRLNLLVSHANTLRAKLTELARSNAERANIIFTLAVIVSTALTLLILISTGHRDTGALFLALIVAINIPFIVWGLSAGGEFLTDEGGVLETSQAAMILGAFIWFCSDAARFGQPSKSAAVILSCICLFMFFREVDFRTYGAPDWVIGLSSGHGRRILFTAGAAFVLYYAVRNYRNLLQLVPAGLKLRAWPFYVWPVLLILGELVEVYTHKTRKDDLHGFWTSGQFWEEMLELDAYILLAYAAVVFGSIMRGTITKNSSRARTAADTNPPGKIN